MSSVKDNPDPKGEFHKSVETLSKKGRKSQKRVGSFDATLVLGALRGKAHAFQKAPTQRRGLPKGWTQMTFHIREELHKKLKDLAYQERVSVKHVLGEMLEMFFASLRAGK